MTFLVSVLRILSVEDPTLHQRVSATGTNLAPGPEIEGSVRWGYRQGRSFLPDRVTRSLCVRSISEVLFGTFLLQEKVHTNIETSPTHG
jgi:hypothetical protein